MNYRYKGYYIARTTLYDVDSSNRWHIATVEGGAWSIHDPGYATLAEAKQSIDDAVASAIQRTLDRYDLQ